MISKKEVYIACICGVVICLSVASFTGWLTQPSILGWYAALNKPAFNPPDWVFAPVWTALYIMIGVSGGLLWSKREKHSAAYRWFILQLGFNFTWSFIFFLGHQIGLALLNIVLLWLSLSVTIFRAYRCSVLAALLLVPYFLWSSFAMLLNASLFLLN